VTAIRGVSGPSPPGHQNRLNARFRI
jgi:hypothetical protein